MDFHTENLLKRGAQSRPPSAPTLLEPPRSLPSLPLTLKDLQVQPPQYLSKDARPLERA